MPDRDDRLDDAGAPPDAEPVKPAKRASVWPKDMLSQIEASKRSKWRRYREWDLCLNMVRGLHDATWSRDGQQWNLPAVKQGRRRKTARMITLQIRRSMHARLAVTYPGVTIAPSTPSIDDILKSQAGDYALQNFWYYAKVKRKFAEAAMWLVDTGNVGFHWYYDPDRDRVELDVVSPYHIFFEDGVNDWRKSTWVAIRSFVRVDELVEQYPRKEERIRSIGPSPDEDADEPNDGSVNGKLEDRIEVFEIYWNDGTKRFARVAGKFWLERGYWPSASLPFSLVRFTEVGRELWGIGTIRPIIALQLEYDDVRDQVKRAVELLGNPMVLYERSSDIANSARANRPGQWVAYTGQPPHVMTVPSLPSFVMDHVVRTQSEMYDISGAPPTTMGKRSAGVTSGASVNALDSKSDRQLVLPRDYLEDAAHDMAEGVLGLMALFYSEDRWVQIFDSTGRQISKLVKHLDLLENPEVHIQPGTLFRDTAEERDQKLTNLLQLGAISPQQYMQEVSYHVDSSAAHKRFLGRAHAAEILEHALKNEQIPIEQRAMGPEGWIRIELTEADDLEAMVEVFEEYIRDQERFLKLSPDVQDFLFNVYKIATSMLMAPMPGQRVTVGPGNGQPRGSLPGQGGNVSTGPLGTPGPVPRTPPPGGTSPSVENTLPSADHLTQASPYGGGLA